MSRPLALLVAFVLLVPAPAALAQSGGGGAFGPLPPAQPAETPQPEEQDDSNAATADEDVSRSTLFLVGIGVLLAFIGLGWAITRDARRNLTEADRAAVEGVRTRKPMSKQERAKARERDRRARQKTRAQRQARKKTRRAGRG
jgi:hypothetical protein